MRKKLGVAVVLMAVALAAMAAYHNMPWGDQKCQGKFWATGLITGGTGLTVTGAAVNLNASSNYGVNIGTGTSTGTLAFGGTGTQTLDIGNGAGIKTVNLGSDTTSSSTNIKAGSGNLDITAAATTFSGNATFLTTTPTVGLALGGGTNGSPLTTATADKSYGLFYTQDTATTGTSRGLYWKHFLGGTAPSGEAARFYTSVTHAGATDAHGAHISLGYSAAGTCTGESAALRSTLHIPTGTLGGTNASAYTEIWADAAGSTASNIQFQRYVLGGDGTGAALIDAAGVLFSAEGLTNGAGNIFYVHAPTTLAAGLKVKVNGTEYVLPLYTTE